MSNNIYKQQMARLLSQLKPSKGRALDVGCGDGNLLLLLENLGWDIYGVDISQAAIEIAKKKLTKKNVFVGKLTECRFPSSYFDAISMRHVLEHLQNPLDTLREIRRVIKKDGILGISVPNIDSIYFRIFKGDWFHLDLQRHLYQFSLKTLTDMLNRAGFRVIKRSVSLEDPFEIFRDILLRLQIRPPAMPKYLLPAIIVLVLFNLPVSLMLSTANRGTSIQIFATPKK
jgi:ubiquinone/menaquinone biosynthesis C-methylase UbiE